MGLLRKGQDWHVSTALQQEPGAAGQEEHQRDAEPQATVGRSTGTSEGPPQVHELAAREGADTCNAAHHSAAVRGPTIRSLDHCHLWAP